MDARDFWRGATASSAALCGIAVAWCSPDDPSIGGTNTGQAIADILKDQAGAEIALIPAGMIQKPLAKNDLATTLSYPDDKLVVISLTGKQIREALDRSLLVYPQANVGFLQVSGIEITFHKNTGAQTRLIDVTVNGAKLQDGHSYEVAMPTSLERGQLGYSNLWDKAKVVRTPQPSSLKEILKDKHPSPSASRWSEQD